MPVGRDNLPGAGWNFPVTVDHKGDIALSTGEANIRDSVRIVLVTAKGERVMQPEFGCEIHDHVFDNIDGTTLTLVEGSVKDALVRWEPRIDIDGVAARRHTETPNKLLVDLDYTVRSTNSASNMVYPFYVTM